MPVYVGSTVAKCEILKGKLCESKTNQAVRRRLSRPTNANSSGKDAGVYPDVLARTQSLPKGMLPVKQMQTIWALRHRIECSSGTSRWNQDHQANAAPHLPKTQ